MPSRVFTEGIGHTNETVSATVDSSGNLVMAKDIKLPAAGGIKTSGGSAIINESGGTVTVTNATLGSTVVGGVPVGAVMPFASVTVPTGFVICNGAEYSRTTYADLFAFLSFTDATCDTNSNTTLTMDSTALVGAGFGVSGTGIPVGTTVSSVTNSTTLVLSQAATATASNVTLTFTRWGVGTSDSNFRVPDFRGEFLRGHDAGRGVDSGRLLGSSQDYATKEHSHTFGTGTDGGSGEQHNIGFLRVYGLYNYGYRNDYGPVHYYDVSSSYVKKFSTAGAISSNPGVDKVTTSTISQANGNPSSIETRPRNLAVQYCIKF